VATSPNISANSSGALRCQEGGQCDAGLVLAAKRGQHGAFGELCERHTKRLFHTTLSITRNREDAEDALQDSFLSAFVHLRKFDGRSSFSTWLTRIAINSALMKVRKNRASRELPMNDPADTENNLPRYEPADSRPDPEECYAHRERERFVAGAVRKLRPGMREVVEIRQLQEFSIKETARILGISVTAAKGRLFHARAALRRASRLKMIQQARGCRAA
jgi:RNA polymerase sigma factor (sigma-70 family)